MNYIISDHLKEEFQDLTIGDVTKIAEQISRPIATVVKIITGEMEVSHKTEMVIKYANNLLKNRSC